MAFWGSTFIFDDISCSEYGLMIYDFGSTTQDDTNFQVGSIVEDRIARRYDSFMYGLSQNQALEYTLVFGANMESVDQNASVDRYEIEAITAWLTGHQTRKWLTIVQDDMDAFRYKCTISELKLITYGNMPWAFSCKVSCDSPFAYTFSEEYNYSVSGTKTINFFNRSSYNGYYCPYLEIELTSGTSLSIQNVTDNNRVFQFTGLPSSNSLKIYIDNKNQVITNNKDLNLYQYFNMKFLRLKRGDNTLIISGNAKIKFVCEFPVNIGG